MKKIEVSKKGWYFSLDKIEKKENYSYVYATDLDKGGHQHIFYVLNKQLETLLNEDFLPQG